MSDAMVTARMPQAKKEAGGRVLERIGSNASQLINDAYDYLIAHGDSPFSRKAAKASSATPQQIAEALSWIDGMCLPANNRFKSMSDEAIRRERLASRGLVKE